MTCYSSCITIDDGDPLPHYIVLSYPRGEGGEYNVDPRASASAGI